MDRFAIGLRRAAASSKMRVKFARFLRSLEKKQDPGLEEIFETKNVKNISDDQL